MVENCVCKYVCVHGCCRAACELDCCHERPNLDLSCMVRAKVLTRLLQKVEGTSAD